MKSLTLLLAAASALTLSGCNMAPKYVRSELPVPESIGSPSGSTDQAAPDQAIIAWQDFFTDARLRDVLQLALHNNRDLRVAVANMEQARALYRVQRADLLPTIGVNGSAAYQDLPGGVPSAENTPTIGGRTDTYTASVGVSAWEIDLFGRVRNQSEAALEQYFASVENRNAAQTALIGEVATAWLTLGADQELLRIAQDMEEAFGRTLELTRKRFASGVASELEVHQAQTSHDRARALIEETRARVEQDRNALNLLVGTIVKAELLPEDLPPGGATLSNLPADLSSEVLLQRPDIAAAEHQLRAANANIGAARAAYFPRLSLTAAFGTMSLGLSNLFDNGSEYWSITPSASLPIFDFGRNKGNLRYAEATQKALLAQYERALQAGFREIADALARRKTIDAQFHAQQSLRDAANSAYRLSEARFRSGIDPFLVTLDSQRALYEAEQSLLATRHMRETNMVALYRALGGGVRG